MEIRGSVSEAFKVQDQRAKFYKMHIPQSLDAGTDLFEDHGKALC